MDEKKMLVFRGSVLSLLLDVLLCRLVARVGACLFLVATEPAFIHTLSRDLPVACMTVCIHQSPLFICLQKLKLPHEV